MVGCINLKLQYLIVTASSLCTQVRTSSRSMGFSHILSPLQVAVSINKAQSLSNKVAVKQRQWPLKFFLRSGVLVPPVRVLDNANLVPHN